MRHRSVFVVALVFAATALYSTAVADAGFKNKYPSEGAAKDCGNGDTIAYDGPLKMWPPNHKTQDVSVTATDGDGDNVTLMITVDPTDAVGGDGGPAHDPDFMFTGPNPAMGDGSATVPLWLRSERSGTGDGRTYGLKADATFDNGMKSCSFEWEVIVPHDMRGGRDW